uniref:Alpha/beta superfamily hydrolase n=1 Tax=Candidatus Kentrum eta TaxID=2126337 RepID=A0A450UDF9_9GAMM|nr:MAG: Alpha/beta superfamily hydrolase [Candidatus Kentron sp. H]VFJ90500.1 MAG: Alpha/beta superfamily hydrolase [Candidatus Kentron sp. H]VFJ96670.1 MAG: Alpha/beta superfamily hydrolase [Candidatus Kentron sp. H]
MNNTVYFAHGQETGPWGTKIRYLAEIARRRGFHVESPDYADIPDPDARVRRLLELATRDPATENKGNLVLVGSSAGGYVSAVASESLNPDGLFLMAPAVFLSGFGARNPQPRAAHRWVVHGWNDETVPAQGVMHFARQHKMQLHMLDDEHRLAEALPTVGALFELFLEPLTAIA